LGVSGWRPEISSSQAGTAAGEPVIRDEAMLWERKPW
jgi:hypothetical protein